MSIIDQQKELEYYPDDVLAQEMMQPTGIAPSFLVATEIKRRNDMRNSYEMQMNQPPQMSVAEEQAMELQGIPNIDPNMMQQQMMQDPMMQEQMPQNAPMQMREGGDIRYQEGEDIDFDKTGGFNFNRGPFGNKIVGEGGILYDPTSKIDNAILAASFFPIGGRAATALGLGGKAAVTGGKAAYTAGRAGIKEGLGSLKNKFSEKISKPIFERIGKFAGKERQLPGMVESVIGKGFVPSYGGKTSIPMQEVGRQATKAFLNPFANPLTSPFYSRTLPSAFASNAVLSAISGENLGTEANATETTNTDVTETTNNNDPRLEGKSLDEMAQILGDDNRQKQALAEKLAADKLAEDAELERRASLPDSSRMLEDAMANLPENTTFQDYLSTLEGMEESRKGQVLMDLGASIANASHGGDIAKGFQEAGTRARAEKIEAAKEKARVLGESRLMDINTSLKMAEIDAALMKSDQITLSGWLDLFADNPDLLEEVEDADDPVNAIIGILDRLGVNTENMKKEKDKVEDK